MESLSREAILRMVGLHDAAHMMRQMNAIQLSLEEEQGRMVAYWTEIRKSEKEVTLLAGRMTDAGSMTIHRRGERTDGCSDLLCRHLKLSDVRLSVGHPACKQRHFLLTLSYLRPISHHPALLLFE